MSFLNDDIRLFNLYRQDDVRHGLSLPSLEHPTSEEFESRSLHLSDSYDRDANLCEVDPTFSKSEKKIVRVLHIPSEEFSINFKKSSVV